MNTILLATDGSPSAKRAASEAIELAKATGWELRIVTAWRIPLATYGYSPLVYPTTDIGDIEREYAAGVLAEAVETASGGGRRRNIRASPRRGRRGDLRGSPRD